MQHDVEASPEGHGSFCSGPASGGGKARLILYAKDHLVAVCGECIESHAELLRHVEQRRREAAGAHSCRAVGEWGSLVSCR